MNRPRYRKRRNGICPTCNGQGWVMHPLDGNKSDLMIERCDECKVFANDHEACVYVANTALGVGRPRVPSFVRKH